MSNDTTPAAGRGSDSSEGLGGWPAILAFLDGSAPLDGVWFGEPHPTERGQFWWRKYLRAAAEQRVPLTDEQIEALFKGVDSEDKGRFAIVRGFAKALEAAHGIEPPNAI